MASKATVRCPHDHESGASDAAVLAHFDEAERFALVAELFRQLGDTTRIRIFWLLSHGEACVVNLSALLDMSSPAVCHHLRPLRSSGLITSRREGKEVYYSAADTEKSRCLHRMIEDVMAITCPEDAPSAKVDRHVHPPRGERESTIRQVHDYLVAHLGERLTIEELSAHFYMNPTTLKDDFKKIYGTSLAAHMREHRMEEAARLLRETDMCISAVATAVGYTSQSRFSAAFKAMFSVLPTDYRRELPCDRT